MEFIENVKEAGKSIQDNLLRTILTASIVAIGITSLVGILTAIDAVKASITEGLAGLGANSFDIKDVEQRRRSRGGVQRKNVEPITYEEAIAFKERYTLGNTISIEANVTGIAELKRFSKKTNPNSQVIGADEYFMDNKGYELKSGRNFSRMELQQGQNVAIVGPEIIKQLFEEGNDPLNESVGFRGNKYKIIGVLDETGGLSSGNTDRSFIIPLENANKYRAQQRLYYNIVTTVEDPARMEFAIGEATGVMRLVRQDQLGKPNSFEIEKSDSLTARLDETSDILRLGGSLIAFVTLIGASIGLMNIMMVSVTERTREIGVRKALGATPGRIREQFLVEAITICLLGGGVGILFGLMIGNLVSLLVGDGSFVVPWIWIMLGLAVCIVVGVFAGYYPARKASRLDPIDSLRYE